jgi:hypothetical protein
MLDGQVNVAVRLKHFYSVILEIYPSLIVVRLLAV